MYQAVNHIRKGYRRSVCGVDTIYFRIGKATVEIMLIIGYLAKLIPYWLFIFKGA